MAIYVPSPIFRNDEKCYAQMKMMAREALETFKDDSGKQYKLVDIVKVVLKLEREYYLTFTGKQCDAPFDTKDDDLVKTIQAVIYDEFTHHVVESCRIKLAKLTV
ncbi:hypothetical protein PHJA_002262000 [Phtheirospermum japonicum]|uniref:Uncharacterized protein n=1 Tax=Phtheirospermum japonicum TaxID=374723 RepID=A0A830CMY9_9LAMI|nr:hypothetical protein PHJA_002262000 [Phtheirospermum japonicum]